MDLQHNIQVDQIKMEIWSDRQSFLNQIIELQSKSETKNDKTNIQDDEEVNTKDSKKIIKNKRIHARSIKQLEKLETMDGNTDDNVDDIVDIKDNKRSHKRSNRRSTRGG